MLSVGKDLTSLRLRSTFHNSVELFQFNQHVHLKQIDPLLHGAKEEEQPIKWVGADSEYRVIHVVCSVLVCASVLMITLNVSFYLTNAAFQTNK